MCSSRFDNVAGRLGIAVVGEGLLQVEQNAGGGVSVAGIDKAARRL